VLDYGMGNLHSVVKALGHIGSDPRIISDLSQLEGLNPSGLVLPGVGALGDCITGLKRSGFDDFIRCWIAEDRPFLGICLGYQALFDHSEEGDVAGLGVFPGRVRHFPRDKSLRVPHMGWNIVHSANGCPFFPSPPAEGSWFYFDHSYFVDPEDPALTAGVTDYGHPFASAIRSGNCFGTQFHPEKSQRTGLRLLTEFISSISIKPIPVTASL
jgi:glutamine amidotransferase